jgi:dephospho-CoA kinase
MIIGISGKAGSGKDTVAQMLFEKIAGGKIITHFADNLKNIISKLLRVSYQDLMNPEFKKKTVDLFPQYTYRTLMQAIGTKFREIDKDFWVKLMMETFKYSDNYTIIIPDVRYKNEAEAIKNKGGVLIRINRDIPEINDHSSETDLDNYKFDYIINNTGTLDDLETKVDTFLKSISIK